MNYFRPNIAAMAGYVPGFQPKELDIIKLNTNENPYPPSPHVLNVLRNLDLERLRRYPDPAGTEFRQAAGRVNDIPADHIMCTNGGDELLSIAVRSFCDKTRPLAYPTPTYSLYPVLAQLDEVPVIEIPFGQDYSLPKELFNTPAALTIVCNPNAPSSSLINVGDLASLAASLKSVLLIDEAYVDFSPCTCIDLVRQFDNVIILRSMSKGYSLAGLRFGYAIAQPSLIEGMWKVKDSYNTDAIAIAAASAAISDQDYVKANVEKVIAQRKVLTEALIALGFKVPPSNANFVLAEFNGPTAQHIYDQLVAKHIFVRYFKLPGLENKLRITVGTPDQNARFLSALKEILAR